MSLVRAAKAAAIQLLRRYHRRLLYLAPGQVAGLDLADDLRVVVANDAPLCLDVGANRGQTIELLRRTFPQPIIHAFEPSSRTFAELEARAFGAGVVLHRFALGAAPESREFTTYASTDLSSFLDLDRDPENRFRSVSATATEVVDIDTVDRFLAREGVARVDLLKIDTQGFDHDVLRGADAALRDRRVAAVMIELNFVRMYEGQAAPSDIVATLVGHGLYPVGFYEIVRQQSTIGWCTALFGRRT